MRYFNGVETISCTGVADVGGSVFIPESNDIARFSFIIDIGVDAPSIVCPELDMMDRELIFFRVCSRILFTMPKAVVRGSN